MLRILWINPVGTDMYDKHIRKIIEETKRPDVEATFVPLSKGPIHIEY